MPPENNLPTMEDIARAAGVAKATVCRALQNRPNVAEATRDKILKAAKELDYQADPSLSALSQRRWSDGGKRTFRQIALIHLENVIRSPNEEPSVQDRFRASPRAQLYPSIRMAAKEMGYEISEHSTLDYKNGEQLARILYNRGIEGLLLSIEGPTMNIDIPWERFSALSIGLDSYDLPHVTSDWMGAVSLAVDTVEKRGYRRVGFINLFHENPSIDYRVGSAIRFQRQRLASKNGEQIPILEVRNEGDDNWEARVRELEKWYKKWKPDVIIDGSLAACHWLETLGIEVPEECGYITLFRTSRAHHEHLTSIDHHYDEQGKWAVDIISTMIQSRIKGQSPLAPRVTIPCSLDEGSTLPTRK